MNRFLVGLGVGMPVGMLLADTFSSRHWQKRAREWVVSSREKVEIAGERIRRAVEEDLGKTPGSGADTVNVAEQARRSSRAQTEHATLNGIERDELLAVYGIGPVLADRIINGRPYRRDYEVVERGILSDTVFAQLRRQVLTKYRRLA